MAQDGSTTPAAAAPATAPTGRLLSGRAREVGLRLGGLAIAIVVVIAIFSILSKNGTFLTVSNGVGILRAMSTIAIVALGLTLVIVVGEIDLSFGYMYGLASTLIAVAWIVWGWPLWLAMPLAFVVAIFIGSVNAFLVAVAKIPSFIVTLGTGSRSTARPCSSNTATLNPQYPPPGRSVPQGEVDFFAGISNQDLPGKFPMQGIWMILVAIVIGFVLSRSLFGFRLKAIGGNPLAAALARLPITKYKFVAFITCSLLASLAAMLDFAFIGSTQPNAGLSLLFPVFAAVIIGGASLAGGRGTAIGTLSGALLLADHLQRPRAPRRGRLPEPIRARLGDHRGGRLGSLHPGPAPMTDAPAPVDGAERGSGLRIRGLTKWYGDTRAVEGLDIDARPGEILGIAGPNGAGKSTLIKILAGEVTADLGDVELDGAPWDTRIDRDRVAVVHQDPQLFPNLTVAENLMVGREGTRAMTRGLTAAERSLMADLAILDYRDRPLALVPLAIQQRVEIGRALARDARVFLFDEPNSALTQEESNDLFRRMHGLAKAGRVVLLVSHRIAELARHASRVVLILDGRSTAILEGATLTQEDIAGGLVVGQASRDVTEQARGRADGAASALRLSGWTHAAGEFSEVDLDVKAGEIVAFVGVEGSGARELVRSMAGFERASGRMDLGGAAGTDVAAATSLVSPDRSSSLSNLTIGENMVSRLDDEIATRGGALRRGRMHRIAQELREQFRVKTGSVHLPIRSLSGGNQQKVAIAAAIVKRPDVLVLEEPTRGVDLGSKSESIG